MERNTGGRSQRIQRIVRGKFQLKGKVPVGKASKCEPAARIGTNLLAEARVFPVRPVDADPQTLNDYSRHLVDDLAADPSLRGKDQCHGRGIRLGEMLLLRPTCAGVHISTTVALGPEDHLLAGGTSCELETPLRRCASAKKSPQRRSTQCFFTNI